MMLVPPESPLRLVPTTVDRKGVLYFDGIRYSLHIFDLAATRLAATILDLTKERPSHEAMADQIALAISDAWMLVDSAHRLRELVSQVPRLRKSLVEVQLFMRRLAPTEELRHHFQHFRTGIDAYADSGAPLWGTLSWAYVDQETGAPSNFTIAPGTFFDGAAIPMCTFDRLEWKYVERVLLQVGSRKLDLAILLEHVREFASWYTNWFAQNYPDTGHHAADVYLQVSVRAVEKEGERTVDGGN